MLTKMDRERLNQMTILESNIENAMHDLSEASFKVESLRTRIHNMEDMLAQARQEVIDADITLPFGTE
jgi:phage shock protein A